MKTLFSPSWAGEHARRGQPDSGPGQLEVRHHEPGEGNPAERPPVGAARLRQVAATPRSCHQASTDTHHLEAEFSLLQRRLETLCCFYVRAYINVDWQKVQVEEYNSWKGQNSRCI